MKYIKSKDDFINEAVSVETNRYERSHGKKPRGTGQWAFYFTSTGGEPIFVPKSMSYSNAVKWAKEEAKKAGETTIYVGESLDEKVNEAKEMSKKEVRDLKIKINNARTIGKYFTKDEVEFLQSLFESNEYLNEGKGDKAVSMAQKKLDKVMADLKANLLKFKGAKTDADKETFKSEAGRLTQLRKDAQNNLEKAIQDAYADVDLVILEKDK